MTRFFHGSKHDYDQTAPKEVILSGYILFTILASKEHKQMRGSGHFFYHDLFLYFRRGS